jgi:hypothetical protein
MSHPHCAGRFALSTTAALSTRESEFKAGSPMAAVTRLLLLEPPDGTAELCRNGKRGVKPLALQAPMPMASWPQRLETFAGSVQEIAGAIDGLFPKSSPIAAIVERVVDGQTTEMRFAIEVEGRDGGSFRIAVLHDVHGHERIVFDGITLSHYRDGQEPTVVRRGSTMLLALWRALAQGCAGAFDLSLRTPPGLPEHIVVLGGSSREPGTGVMGLELEIDRVLLNRRDPRAVRQISLQDVDDVTHCFLVQATVGKIELSLFRGSRSS